MAHPCTGVKGAISMCIMQIEDMHIQPLHEQLTMQYKPHDDDGVPHPTQRTSNMMESKDRNYKLIPPQPSPRSHARGPQDGGGRVHLRV